MPAPFDLLFMQRALLEVVVLALAAGLAGTWIVLRGLSFYSHAVATAAFPGLVLADGLGFAAPLGAAATGLLMALGVTFLGRRRGEHDADAPTALVLVGALAAGVILASDVFDSGGSVEQLLFGSLLLVDPSDVALAAVVAVVVALTTWLVGRRWVAIGFDRSTAAAIGIRPAIPDALLLGIVAAVAVASLTVLGALLATAMLVVPAATTRRWSRGLGAWQAATVGLVLAEGIAGLALSYATNAPPGATIAVLAAGVFAAGELARRPLRGPRRAGLAALAATAAVLVAAVAAGGQEGGRGGVVATTTQLGDITRAIAGGDVAVTQLLHPNTDPHDYEPRPRDVGDVAHAAAVLESGRGLDRWMGEVVDRSGAHPPIRVLAPGPAGARRDPHWWHDPRAVERAIPVIRDAVRAAAPAADRAAIDRRAAAYLGRVRALDAAIARCMAGVPASERRLVTDHDAFGAFARRYGITVVGAVIPAQTTQAQASAGDVAALVRLIRRAHVRAIFPEHSVNAKLARAIARRTGARADLELYGDTLGPRGSHGATYLTMEAANADAMVRGFTGGRRGCPIRV